MFFILSFLELYQYWFGLSRKLRKCKTKMRKCKKRYSSGDYMLPREQSHKTDKRPPRFRSGLWVNLLSCNLRVNWLDGELLLVGTRPGQICLIQFFRADRNLLSRNISIAKKCYRGGTVGHRLNLVAMVEVGLKFGFARNHVYNHRQVFRGNHFFTFF